MTVMNPLPSNDDFSIFGRVLAFLSDHEKRNAAVKEALDARKALDDAQAEHSARKDEADTAVSDLATLRDTLNQKTQELKDLAVSLEQREQALAAAQAQAEERAKALDAREKDVAAQEEALGQKLGTHAEITNTLDADRKALDMRAAELEAKEADYAERVSKLRAMLPG